MSKNAKAWLFIALSLTLLGALIFTGAMCAINWDFPALSTTEYVTNTYEVTEDFKDVSIKCSTADVTILPSPDGTCKVECADQVNISYNVVVSGETLHVTVEDSRKWYEYIDVNFGTASSSIKLYLPKGACRAIIVFNNTGDVSIDNIDVRGITLKITTGDISISNFTCKTYAWLRGSTGRVTIENAEFKSLTSTAGTGDITLKNVIAQEKLDITRTTGKITFDYCDAAEIYATTNTGDVTGTLLSSKMFSVDTSTGNVNVPSSAAGGKCEIKTSTGDVKINIVE